MKHMHASYEPTPEFSRPVAAEAVPAESEEWEFSAEPEERQALARRFDLLAVNRLSVRARLRPLRGGLMRVEGHISAAVEQSCVVTLEPVESRIEESFVVLYGPPSSVPEPATYEVVVSPDDDDPPEPIEHGVIDLGEVAAQQLALALDPYPRAANADIASLEAEAGRRGRDRGASPSPFDALAALKRRR
ncbi:MAG: DUF177 domain-containing protein [Kiloniellales bacterium]